jgi:PAS domain S-box-containing protein
MTSPSALLLLKREALMRHTTHLSTLIGLLGLCLSVAVGLWQKSDHEQRAEAEFQHRSTRIAAQVEQRLQLPIYGLNGLRGAIAAQQKMLSRTEFRAYVGARDLPKEFPGIRGFGFIAHVQRADLGAFVAAERADGAPQFSIRTLGDETHDDLYVVKLIESSGLNAGALGLDIGSEGVRRAAVQRAVDTGKPTLTAALALVQNTKQSPGMLLFVPVYKNGPQPTNAQERRASLLGLLYAPIVMSELLNTMPDVTEKQITFDLIDDAGPQGATLLFDASHETSQLANPLAAPLGARFSQNQSFWMLGRALTLRVSSTPQFDASIDHVTPWLTLAGGALTSLLLALLLRQQMTGRRRAELMAESMTRTLRRDEERAHDFSLCASDWFWETDAKHRFSYFSENFEQAYGLSPKQLLGNHPKDIPGLGALNSPEIMQAHFAQREARMIFRDFEFQVLTNAGLVVWVMVSGRPHLDAQGHFAGYRGVGIPIDKRKKLEIERADLTLALQDRNTELDKARILAEQGNQAKSDFLSHMSHELRTPLNAILGFSQMLESDEPPLSPAQQQSLDQISKAGWSLLSLIDEILERVAAESGQQSAQGR